MEKVPDICDCSKVYDNRSNKGEEKRGKGSRIFQRYSEQCSSFFHIKASEIHLGWDGLCAVCLLKWRLSCLKLGRLLFALRSPWTKKVLLEFWDRPRIYQEASPLPSWISILRRTSAPKNIESLDLRALSGIAENCHTPDLVACISVIQGSRCGCGPCQCHPAYRLGSFSCFLDDEEPHFPHNPRRFRCCR